MGAFSLLGIILGRGGQWWYWIKYDSVKKDTVPDIETLILEGRQEIWDNKE